MSTRFERVELGAGNGLVVVAGSVAVFVATGDAADRLVAVAREVAGSGPAPGRALARRLAVHLAGEDPASVPAFGALAPDEAGWVLLVHGAVAVSFVDPDGSERCLSGTDSVTWLDRILPAGIGPVLIGPVGLDPPGASATSLEGGVVPGGWLRVITDPSGTATTPGPAAQDAPHPGPLEHESAGQEASEQEAAEQEAAGRVTLPPAPPGHDAEPARSLGAVAAGDLPTGPIERFDLSGGGTEPRGPLPVDGTPAEPTPTEPAPAEPTPAEPAPNFGPTDAGTGSAPLPPAQAPGGDGGLRSLGLLVFDDGSTFDLDGNYVIGREPTIDPAVISGAARPIVLDDADGTLSRVHAEIRTAGGQAQLLDRGSTNGTHLWDAANEAWVRLDADRPQIIGPGARGALGRRTFVFEPPV